MEYTTLAIVSQALPAFVLQTSRVGYYYHKKDVITIKRNNETVNSTAWFLIIALVFTDTEVHDCFRVDNTKTKMFRVSRS